MYHLFLHQNSQTFNKMWRCKSFSKKPQEYITKVTCKVTQVSGLLISTLQRKKSVLESLGFVLVLDMHTTHRSIKDITEYHQLSI